MLAVLKHHLHQSVNTMKQKADTRRSDREFQIGQCVFLKLQRYRQVSAATRSTKKLTPWFYRPYKVTEKIGLVAYKLKLPPESRIHSTFYVSLLKLCPDPHLKQRHPPVDYPTVPSSQYTEKILANRVGRRKKHIITEVLYSGRDILKRTLLGSLSTSYSSSFLNFRFPTLEDKGCLKGGVLL